jgi:predicted transcriptional regulator
MCNISIFLNLYNGALVHNGNFEEKGKKKSKTNYTITRKQL